MDANRDDSMTLDDCYDDGRSDAASRYRSTPSIFWSDDKVSAYERGYSDCVREMAAARDEDAS